MWKNIVAWLWISAGLTYGGPPPQDPYNPYVSCPDGHIVTSLHDCPAQVVHKPSDDAPTGGGPHGRGGLLGLGIGGIL